MQDFPSADSGRAYGVLATSFNEALREARNALAEHSHLLPPGRLGEMDAMLEEFARRRVRIAVYGEVKAGKSTLVNALAGATLSPTAFDPLTSVPISITYGLDTGWHIGGRGFANVEELAEAMRGGNVDGSEVTVTTALDILQLGGQVDIVDTPGVGSEDRLDVVTANVLRSLDAVVLVVRYPALFTQFTRRLVEQLQADISKLFVVWNVDAACTELSQEERERQKEMLRRNVAGAHDLFLVDAKRAFAAAQQRSEEGLEASGLKAFVEALAAFAGSSKREVAALREASKRAQQWLGEPLELMNQRQSVLEQSLSVTRQRLRTLEQQIDERGQQARAAFANLQAALGQAAEHHKARARELAAVLRKQLKGARREWIRNADSDELQHAVDAATNSYADSIDLAMLATIEAFRDAAAGFGSTVDLQSRPRLQPAVASLSPEERVSRARTGSLPRLRRSLWRNWYLPGLTTLETATIDDELRSQDEWLEQIQRDTEAAARSVLDQRVAEIQREGAAQTEALEQETNFKSESAELQALNRNAPSVHNARAQVDDIAAEAWYLSTT
ncbi:MAG TPA: dynamin family protein [Terriglobales bacterium]|nr:dynamin family protein [Terriglobales bacterium]